jgi:hypothetical protein
MKSKVTHTSASSDRWKKKKRRPGERDDRAAGRCVWYEECTKYEDSCKYLVDQ